MDGCAPLRRGARPYTGDPKGGKAKGASGRAGPSALRLFRKLVGHLRDLPDATCWPSSPFTSGAVTDLDAEPLSGLTFREPDRSCERRPAEPAM